MWDTCLLPAGQYNMAKERNETFLRRFWMLVALECVFSKTLQHQPIPKHWHNCSLWLGQGQRFAVDEPQALDTANDMWEDKQINRCFSETTLDKFVTPVLLHSTVLQSSMWHGFHEYVMNCIELSSLSGREHGTRWDGTSTYECYNLRQRLLRLVAGIICQVCSNQSRHMMAHASPLCQPLFWIGWRLIHIQTFASPSKWAVRLKCICFLSFWDHPQKSQKRLPLSYNFPPKGQLQQGLLGISGMNQRQYLSFRSAHQTLRGRLHQYWLIHLLLVHHLCRSLKAWDWKIKQIKTD